LQNFLWIFVKSSFKAALQIRSCQPVAMLCHWAWWCTPLHADRLLPPLPMVNNVNNGKLTDFATISLTKIAGNLIYTCYGTIWKLYANEKLK